MRSSLRQRLSSLAHDTQVINAKQHTWHRAGLCTQSRVWLITKRRAGGVGAFEMNTQVSIEVVAY